MNNPELRKRIVDEARSWIGTPYHVCGKIKGVGCDCATLILMTMQNCGLFSGADVDPYAQNFWFHTTNEKYFKAVLRNARKILETTCRRSTKIEPGNIVLGRVGSSRIFNHGAIVTEYPFAVHATKPAVMEFNLLRDRAWFSTPAVIFDPTEKEPENV